MDDCTKTSDAYDIYDASGRAVVTVNGAMHMYDAKGRLVPLESIRDTDKLEDQAVRKIVSYAVPLSEQVARFREHTFDDVDALLALLDEKYGVKKGGQKGNVTLTSYDGLLKVTVQIGENISFGPELQQAKSLVDECVTDWVDGVRAELRVLIDGAFQVDKHGQINRGRLLALRRYEFADDRWKRAMQAITDSIRVIGTKRYVRIYRRENAMAPWLPVVIDVAAS